jgi:hypothetical protein
MIYTTYDIMLGINTIQVGFNFIGLMLVAEFALSANPVLKVIALGIGIGMAVNILRRIR